jgi:hypothetical protein
MENTIGILETQTGIVLKNLIETLANNQLPEINNADRSTLIKFIWLQMNRTVESRIHWGNLKPHLISKLTDTSYSIEANEMLKDSDNSDEHLTFLSSSIENSFALNTLGSRNFIVVKNDTSIDFIISDHPVVKYTHWEINHNMHEIFMPINCKYGIWIFPKGLFKELDDADNKVYELNVDDNIKFYNYLQVSQSTRQLFSMTSNFDYVEEILENAPSLKDINRQRLE